MNSTIHFEYEKHMRSISQGSITLNDDRIQQKWTVDIVPFLLAQYPVSQELYATIMHAYPSTFTGSQKPVESVSWKDAILFCNALSIKTGLPPCYHLAEETEFIRFDDKAAGYRLPTEAEWQYACKAGTTGIRYGELEEIAWYKANSHNTTHDVGLKEPNAWGLYDMIGNVWEWCTDIYDETVYGSYRIFRGGGWADEARSCMATTRRRSHPISFKIEDLGFRIARTVQD